MFPFRRDSSGREHGVALIIVLAFVVLLTALVVAFFSRSAVDREVVRSSLDEANAEILARSACDVIVGDFRQEIVNGSQPVAFSRYTPSSNDNVVPQRSGNPPFGAATTDPVANLIRRSVFPDTMPPPGISSRASQVNSTSDAAVNGRSIAISRWNTHYLLPLHDPTGASGSIPKSPIPPPNGPGDAAGFTPPDWVIVTRAGPQSFPAWSADLRDSSAANSNYAIGRYAYAVYDEGGLLDANVAGFPTSVNPSATDIGRKGTIAFADLSVLPTTGAGTMTAAAINKLVLFRNYATTGSNTTLQAAASFSAAGTQGFVDYFLGNPQVGTSQNYGMVRPLKAGGRTDQSFVTRAELIAFRNSTGIASLNTLQYLGTFSREKNAATWRGGATTASLEAALAQRFYIGALFPVTPGSAPQQTTIGLQWQAGAASGHWNYIGPTGAAALDHIPALSATAHDFFATLNYGLHGIDGDDFGNIGSTLAVGASLIDQYDGAGAVDPVSGSTTTAIQYGGGTEVYGFETTDPARQPAAPTPPPAGPVPVVISRPFRNAGEFGYGVKTNLPGLPTINFQVANPDAPLMDLFTYNSAAIRSGTVSLNTRQPAVLAAILKGVLTAEAAASSNVTSAPALNAANAIVNGTGTAGGAATSRADIPRLVSLVQSTPFNAAATEEVREAIARALSDTVQTRTWGLLIDVIAQSGRYSPNATALSEFVVQGEKHYWLHVAIDRFTGEVIDQQLEAVYE